MIRLIRKHRLLLKDALLSSFFCLFLTYILSLILLNLSFLNPFKEAFKDFSFSDIYYSENIQEDSLNKDIILINIERKNRFELGLLLESILEAKPKVVGIDAIFKDLKKNENDQYLAEILKNKTIVSSINIEENSVIKNHSFFKPRNEAFVNINFNGSENVIRSFEGFYKKDTSFATKIAFDFNNKIDFKHLKKSNIIKYTGNYKSFIHFSFDEFMLLEDKSIVQEKIILLGYLGIPLGSNYDIEDKFFTPLNAKTSGKSLPDMFGVVIHANILKMILENDFIYEISTFWTWIFTYISVFIFMVFLLKLEKKGEIYNRTFKWFVLLSFTAILLYLHMVLYSYKIYLNVFNITAISVIASNLFIFYVHSVKFLKTKTTWKSYLN